MYWYVFTKTMNGVYLIYEYHNIIIGTNHYSDTNHNNFYFNQPTLVGRQLRKPLNRLKNAALPAFGGALVCVWVGGCCRVRVFRGS